jgi:lipopolysaccharide transport system ATP-binding protein
MNIVIRVENLSKKYLIRHEKRERYTALRDVMAIGVKRMFNRGIVQPFKRLTSNSTNQQFNDLTSANSSSSTVQQPRNSGHLKTSISRLREESVLESGAGKSTLLKILSRITEPTTGRMEIMV